MTENGQGQLDFEDRARMDKPRTSPVDKYYGRGRELFGRGRYVDAAGCFRRALQLNRNHRESQVCLGICLNRQGYHAQAVELFSEVLSAEPDNADALLECGESYQELTKYSEAERCYRRAISVEPDNPRGYLGLGEVLYSKGLYTDSINILRKGLARDEGNTEILFMLGEAYNKNDLIDMAVECFESVLEKEKENPKVYYNLGILYDKKAMTAQANQMYRRAKELSSPRGSSMQKLSASPAGQDEDTFFSRSLTVVDAPEETRQRKTIDRARYEKFRRRQMRKKKDSVVDVPEHLDRSGKMDLTKASLKIHEALNMIKRKKK